MVQQWLYNYYTGTRPLSDWYFLTKVKTETVSICDILNILYKQPLNKAEKAKLIQAITLPLL